MPNKRNTMNTRTLVTQMLEALEWADNGYIEGTPMQTSISKAITAAREWLAAPESEAMTWLVTLERQDGTRSTVAMTGRFKDVKDCCDFGEPIPLFTHPASKPHDCGEYGHAEGCCGNSSCLRGANPASKVEPLTLDEIKNALGLERLPNAAVLHDARAIEQAVWMHMCPFGQQQN